MKDSQYQSVEYNLNELEHQYGKNVHILSNPILFELLAKISSPKSEMPLINLYLEQIYIRLLQEVVAHQGSCIPRTVATRMGVELEATMLDLQQRFITVDLARAGTFPSHLCFHHLSMLLDPTAVHQDHVYINRKVDDMGQVVGVDYSGSKLGGDQEGAIVLFPDPMGATGGSLCHVIDMYKKEVPGTAKKYVAMHLIVTPEYIKRLQQEHPDIEIYAVRLDRGLSSENVLDSTLGALWDKEQGLNDHQYIIPGAGGVGELLNNTKN